MKTSKNYGAFSSEKELQLWLQNQGIDLSKWDCGSAKSIQNLLTELATGDCLIQLNPPLRVIHVVQVLIFRENSILVELEQEMNDLRKRKRNLPPSEKMKIGENCFDAAVRCLEEELSVSRKNITILIKEYKPFIRYRTSRSYPGLRSKYYVYRVKVEVDGLPHENFWSEEKTDEVNHDVIRRHYWGWKYLKNIKYPD
jgi:hypothetical protein